jgi:hypothetical protein
MIGRLENNELERLWKEAAPPNSKHNPTICLEGLMKTHVRPLRITGVRAEKGTRDLLNMMQECYPFYRDTRPTGRQVYIRKTDIMNRPK